MIIILFKTAVIIPLLGLCLVVALSNYLLAAQINLLYWYYSDQYCRLLKRKLLYATTISEYAAVAVELDRRLGLETWKKDVKGNSYDYHKIQVWHKSLTLYLETRSIDRICDIILQAQKVGHGGAFSPDVYSYTYWNTKDLIIDYHKLVMESLEYLTEGILTTESSGFKLLTFITQMNSLWGRCALILEGKRSALYYQYGVCKGLLHLRCVPQMIYAQETNALLGAWLSLHADTSLPDDPQKAKLEEDIMLAIKLLKGSSKWYRLSFKQRKRILSLLSALYGDISLLEAYNISGRELHLICRRQDQYYVMNQKTTPDVSITSAVLACMCDDVLQPTGGGCVRPSLLDDCIPVTGLWGLVVREQSALPNLLPRGMRVGHPNDPLTGTAARDVVSGAQGVRELLKEMVNQLLLIICSMVIQTTCHHGLRSGGLRLGFSLGYGSTESNLSSLLTSSRNQVLLCPKKDWRLWSGSFTQIAVGLSLSFQNACLIKTKLGIEKALITLTDAAATAGHAESAT